MNLFIYRMGGKIRELRELMNWTQEDMAKAIGISRPSMIALERDPSRLDKTVALAIFLVVTAELSDRRDRLNDLSYSQWDQLDKQSVLIAALAGLGLTGRFLGKTVAGIAAGMVLTGVGAVTAGLFSMQRAQNLVSYLSKPKSKQSTPADITAAELKDFSEKSFLLLENSVKVCLGVDKLDLREFRNKLEDGESQEDEECAIPLL